MGAKRRHSYFNILNVYDCFIKCFKFEQHVHSERLNSILDQIRLLNFYFNRSVSIGRGSRSLLQSLLPMMKTLKVRDNMLTTTLLDNNTWLRVFHYLKQQLPCSNAPTKETWRIVWFWLLTDKEWRGRGCQRFERRRQREAHPLVPKISGYRWCSVVERSSGCCVRRWTCMPQNSRAGPEVNFFRIDNLRVCVQFEWEIMPTSQVHSVEPYERRKSTGSRR